MRIKIDYLLVLSLVTMLLVSGCGKKAESDKKPATGRSLPKVDGFIVKPVVLENEVSVSGSLLAFEEVDLKNEVAGRVVKINLPEGQFVKEGTLLVKLFDDDLQANLKKLQSQLAIQEDIQKRQSELMNINGISQNEYDQTVLQVNSLRAEIEVQKTLIRKTEVLAPFDGVIGLRKISVGAVVSSSTSLASIRAENQLKLDFSVPEKYSSKIEPGLEVEFFLSGNPAPFSASVIATERGIDESTRNLKVRAVVKNPSRELIPGAFTNVKLILGKNEQALMIPTQALIPKERDKSVIVCRDGIARMVPVKTGIRHTSSVEITEGLEAGDTIVTSGILFVRDGMKISFSNLKKGDL
ncbi:MAG TPA: efflux RND transporter periplasmic adaptor subunit [Prolixibacteraceae bacterium]|nr:efflux RND transporter periplasmic adaptor subunit [Prolixibacteraceae bacterium]